MAFATDTRTVAANAAEVHDNDSLRMWRRELMSITFDMQRTADRITEPLRHRHDLTQQQLLVLTTLENKPDQRPSHISDKLGILRANFTSICHKLEQRGLVCRKPCEDDRRAYELHLTDAGHALLDELDGEIDTAFKRAIDEMPQETVTGLVEGCKALRAVHRKMHEHAAAAEAAEAEAATSEAATAPTAKNAAAQPTTSPAATAAPTSEDAPCSAS